MRNGTFILLYSKVPYHPARSNTPQHHSRRNNLVSATGKNKKGLKEVKRIRNSYQNLRITSPILGNMTYILLYSKTPNHPALNNSLRYHSNSQNLVSGTGKHYKPLKERNRIWKYYKNIWKPLAISINGSSIMPY